MRDPVVDTRAAVAAVTDLLEERDSRRQHFWIRLAARGRVGPSMTTGFSFLARGAWAPSRCPRSDLRQPVAGGPDQCAMVGSCDLHLCMARAWWPCSDAAPRRELLLGMGVAAPRRLRPAACANPAVRGGRRLRCLWVRQRAGRRSPAGVTIRLLPPPSNLVWPEGMDPAEVAGLIARELAAARAIGAIRGGDHRGGRRVGFWARRCRVREDEARPRVSGRPGSPSIRMRCWLVERAGRPRDRAGRDLLGRTCRTDRQPMAHRSHPPHRARDRLVRGGGGPRRESAAIPRFAPHRGGRRKFEAGQTAR